MIRKFALGMILTSSLLLKAQDDGQARMPWYEVNPSTRATWGPDKRAEAGSKWEYRNYVRATATAFDISQIKGDQVWSPTLRQSLVYSFKQANADPTGQYNFDPGVRYLDQPAGGFCTGFLIAPDILVTAGHCITDEESLKKAVWVFDYTADVPYNASTQTLTIPTYNQYRGVEILDRDLFTFGAYEFDFAFIRLDRPVTNRKPYKFRVGGFPKNDQFVAMIGSPQGLPLKISDSARVTNALTQDSFYFKTNLTAFHGNSGGPVFAENGFIEGILVRGPKNLAPKARVAGMAYDFHFDETCNCIKQDVYFDLMSWAGLPATHGTEVHRINQTNRYFLLYSIYRNLELAIQNGNAEEFNEWSIYSGIFSMKLEDYKNKGTNLDNLLFLAVRNYRTEFAEKIMEQEGIDFNMVNSYNNPLIHVLVSYGQYDLLVKANSLANGALDVNKTNDQGETALMVAARSGNMNMVEWLLSNGAAVKATNSSGKTARDIAKDSGNKEIAKRLKKAEKGK